MQQSRTDLTTANSDRPGLLLYIADLELEVDRLRKQAQFIQHEVRTTLKRIHTLCTENPAAGDARSVPAKIDDAARELALVLRDAQERAGYHPAFDQVVAVAVRPLVQQLFRWHQRLVGGTQVELRLDLESEHVEWFPARLRHILDNLVSNALKYRDASKSESWVQLSLQTSPEAYEFRLADNGVGWPSERNPHSFDLFYRAAATRTAEVGVGLAVVKLLVEQSGGTLTLDSGHGQGSTFVVVLPRYDVDDFLA